MPIHTLDIVGSPSGNSHSQLQSGCPGVNGIHQSRLSDIYNQSGDFYNGIRGVYAQYDLLPGT
ncbi:uncharacterized protein ATNIH1004_005170 [Aspergillus tanneri]|nr:uncharacterized protein ATNIH1004_005170 [Aspergillus tanneri]KAA8649269.1 hypothetical protein ATNIH1004_005170 [Aspergillus tanneri]